MTDTTAIASVVLMSNALGVCLKCYAKWKTEEIDSIVSMLRKGVEAWMAIPMS